MAKPTLPDGSQSLDPVPENPFKETNPRHRTWGDATKRAEETLLKLNSATLGSLSPEGNPTRMLEHESARFDVWAERGLYVVWSDQDLAAFDAWLLSYASALLHKAVGTYGDDNPWAESYLVRLKVKLMARVDHWRALARQCRRELEIDSARVRSGGGSGGESQEGIEREPTAASSGPLVSNKKVNKARVDAYIREVFDATGRKLTRKDFWQAAGYKHRTEFQRWQANSESSTRAARENFERVLRTKPHLKKSR